MAVDKIKKPEDAHRAWGRAIATYNVDELLELYEPNNVYITDTKGTTAKGMAELRKALNRMIKMDPEIDIETKYCIVAGDVALLSAKWRVKGKDENGNLVDETHHSTEVVRRQPDGSWLYIIDHPFGAE